jgi:hypothetical protein
MQWRSQQCEPKGEGGRWTKANEQREILCIYIDNWYIIDIVSHYIDNLLTVKSLLLLPSNLNPEPGEVLMIFYGEASLDPEPVKEIQKSNGV